MNNSLLSIITIIKNAIRIKKLKISLKFSKHNLYFLKYLLKQGFISNYMKTKNKLCVILKYENLTVPSLDSSSFCYKRTCQKSKIFKRNKPSNFTLNLFENNKKRNKLLARFK